MVNAVAEIFFNLRVTCGRFIFQPVIGKMLDFGWHGALYHGIRVYVGSDYTSALSILPVCLFIAGLFSLAIKETCSKKTTGL